MTALDNKALLQAINLDRALGSALLFPHRHKQATPHFHIQIMDMWRSADPFVVIQAFREGAKTTLSEEFLLMEAAFGNFRYALLFGETYTKSIQRIEAIKHEILTNDKLRSLFGNLKGKVWSENKIVLPNGVCLEAHGWEEEIRGYKHLDARPDRAYLDDIENKEMVRDTKTVDRNWRKLHGELMPAMDKENGKIRMTNTPLADDCMVTRASNSPYWTSAKFPIADRDPDDPEAQSLWEERFPIEWIRELKHRMEAEGMLREFNQERMLIPAGAQGKPFTEEMLTFQDVAPTMYAPRVAIMDPARTVNSNSDTTGDVVVSRIGSTIYVHESDGNYLMPDKIIDRAFDLSQRHDDAKVAIEKNSLDEWLMQPMRNEMLQRGKTLNLQPLTAPQDRDKVQFIMGLQPFFEAHDIVFVGGRAKHQKLISQLLNFPSGKRDTLNALAYAPKVFSGVPVYGDFGQHNIVSGYTLQRQSGLLLGCNATGTETTAILCALDGRYLTVLADWVSPLMPNDAIPDIAMLIRGMFPGRRTTAWVPAEIMDQVGRDPLVVALKAAGLPPQRSEYALMSRGSLSPSIRTEVNGRRIFMVDSQANNTLQAMAMGYNWPIQKDGTRASDPEKGLAKTLMEGLECLTTAINKIENALPSAKVNAVNTTGTPYMSALPGR